MPPAAKAGDEVGKYRLGNMLGAGAAGAVFEATDTETGDTVALKLLLPDYLENENVQRRFIREVAVLQKLDHDNIVRHLDCGLHNDSLFFTMEVVTSGSLADAMRGQLPWRESVEVAIQVCDGLQHLHENGIIHRDLKPNNLFLSPEGRVKLGDFGVARDTNNTRLTVTGQTVGTCRYMAPEQLVGDDDITAKLDLYAVGCILFEMLTGHVPFDDPEPLTMARKRLAHEVPPVTQWVIDCPPRLVKLVSELLQIDPAQRPADAASVQRTLEEILVSPDEAAEAEPVAESGTPAKVAQPNLTERLQSTNQAMSDRVSWKMLALIGAAIVIGIAVIVITQN